MRKERDFVFTKEIFDDLVAREIKRFKEAEISKLQNPKAPVVFIENKVVDIKLNGYRANNPVGKRASEAEIFLF